MKKILIAGNWKMNTNAFEAIELSNYIAAGLVGKALETQILVCPPFTNIQAVGEVIKNTAIFLGAQNCHYECKGAYTGEISLPMLKHLGCKFVIVGHSERRTYFAETDEIINKKAKAVLDFGLKLIICIGETLSQRQNGDTFQILEHQLDICMKSIDPKSSERVIIAYEPVWAIGTGISATTEQIQEAHAFIREKLEGVFIKNAASILILYGGSVNLDNARSILELEDVNGALIGGASLKADVFLSIINDAEAIIG